MSKEIVPLADRLLLNYEKSIEAGQCVLAKVVKVLLKGRILLDLFNSLSNVQKKKFNPSQQDNIRNGLPLEVMDITMLDLIRREFGGLTPDDPLEKELKSLKSVRNTFAHEKITLKLDEAQLKTKVRDLQDLYTRIYRELKKMRYPGVTFSFDTTIADMRDYLKKLEVVWNPTEVLKSLKSDSDVYASKACKVTTVEGLNESCRAKPTELLTEFVVVKVRKERLYDKDWHEKDEIQYKHVLELKNPRSGDNFEVTLMTGEPGMGKTTFSKFIGHSFGTDPAQMSGLTNHDLMIYLECRNRNTHSLMDLIKSLFQNTQTKFNMEDQELMNFVLQQKLLFVVDGFDEIHQGTRNTLSHILQLIGHQVIVTTRPRSLRNLKDLVPDTKEHVTVQLMGILPEFYEQFISKLLAILIPDTDDRDRSNERRKLCKELVEQFRKMSGTFGTFLNIPMILTNLIHLKVDDPETMRNFSNITGVYEALRGLRITKVRKRIGPFLLTVCIDFESLIGKFIIFHDRMCAKTFIEGQFEIPEEISSELEAGLTNLGIPIDVCDQLLTAFLATHMYYEGAIPKKERKFYHTTEQEFGTAKFYARLIIHVIVKEDSLNKKGIEEDINLIEGNILWEYITGQITERELRQRKDQLPRFKTMTLFLVGELTRLLHNKIPENLAKRLIHIGWYSTESIGWSDTSYGEDISTGSDSNEEDFGTENDDAYSEEENLGENREVQQNQHILDHETHSIESDTDTETDTCTRSDADTESNIEEEDEDEEQKDKFSKSGKEDALLGYVLEAKMDKNMIKEAINQLSSNKTWHIMKSESLPSLYEILKIAHPEKLIILLQSDPTMNTHLKKIIKKAKELEIEIQLFLEQHYNGNNNELSNEWLVSKKLKLTEFWGRVDAHGIARLPYVIRALHLSISKEMLEPLNRKLADLKEITVLGIRLNLQTDLPHSYFSNLLFNGQLNITIICPMEDEDAEWLARTLVSICPTERNGELTECWLQDTQLTDNGIKSVIAAMDDCHLYVRKSIKIWTSVAITNTQQQNLMLQAQSIGHGGLEVFDTRRTETQMPKTITTINTESLVEMVEDFKKLSRTPRKSKEAKRLLLKMRKIEEIWIHKEGKYGRLEIYPGDKIVLTAIQNISSVPEVEILEYEDVMSIAVQPTQVFLELDYKGTTLGKLIIQLDNSSPRHSEQFQQLCSGDNTIGVSYLGAGFDDGLWSAGSPGEGVFCPGYLLPGADGGRGQLQLEAMFQVEGWGPSTTPLTAGLVVGRVGQSAGFYITTITDTVPRTLPVIGRVTSGLSDLQAAAAKGDDYVKAIRFKDCGIVINHGTTTPAAAAAAVAN